MTIGNRIRKIRKFRNMTQQQLGEFIGLDNSRIRQYELNFRTPKENLLKKIAAALNVNEYALLNPCFNSPILSIYSLFEFEEIYGFDITKSKLNNKDPELNELIDLWTKKKQELKDEKIEENEYIEWKLNFKKY